MGALPSAEGVRGAARSLYERGTAPAKTGDPIALEPHALPREAAEALDGLAVAERVTRSLEVGLGLGLASLALCAALLENAGADGRHATLDPFQTADWRGAGRRTLRDAGVAPICEVLEEESQLALSRLAAAGRRFDLALIDGDHRFEAAFVDMYFADRMLEPGGVLVADDLWMPAIRSTVSYFEANLGYEPMAGLAASLRSRRSWHPLRRGGRVGRCAVLRKPHAPRQLGWSEFHRFTAR